MRTSCFELTPGFILSIAWLNFIDSRGIFPLAALACIIHEFGHCAAIWRFGGRIRRIKLSVVGAEICLDSALGYIPEGIIALSGPGINLCSAFFSAQFNISYLFSGINLVLGCFNLLPLKGLDGSRALYCVFALLVDAESAEKILAVLNRIVLAVFAFSGFYLWRVSGNFTIMCIVIWLIAVEIGKKDGFRSCQRGWKRLK